MSEILDKLAACERVTEWINPWDERLVRATGETPPNGGAALREAWPLDETPTEKLEAELSRIWLPRRLALNGLVKVTTDEETGSVVFGFPPIHWTGRFPASRRTLVHVNQRGERSWAAVGLCGDILGLAIFGHEHKGITHPYYIDPEIGVKSVEARVQHVPEEVFAKIISA